MSKDCPNYSAGGGITLLFIVETDVIPSGPSYCVRVYSAEIHLGFKVGKLKKNLSVFELVSYK